MAQSPFSDRQRKYLHASSSGGGSSSSSSSRARAPKPMQPMHNIKVAINTTAPSQPKANSLPRPRSTLNRPGAGQPNTPSQGLPSPSSGQSGQSTAPTKKKVSLPKHPPKEPTPPKDVKKARKMQTAVLKERQKRETQGKMKPGMRDVDAGSGSWPPLSPLL